MKVSDLGDIEYSPVIFIWNTYPRNLVPDNAIIKPKELPTMPFKPKELPKLPSMDYEVPMQKKMTQGQRKKAALAAQTARQAHAMRQ